MNKATFLDALREERRRWEALLAEVGALRMTERGLPGGWSVKDVVAHVTWSERETVVMLRERSLSGTSELWYMDQDERNEVVYEENRDRDVEDVLMEAREVYGQLLAGLEGLDEAGYVDPARFAGMPADWRPWRIFVGNTTEHYQAHAPAIRAWLDAAGQGE